MKEHSQLLLAQKLVEGGEDIPLAQFSDLSNIFIQVAGNEHPLRVKHLLEFDPGAMIPKDALVSVEGACHLHQSTTLCFLTDALLLPSHGVFEVIDTEDGEPSTLEYETPLHHVVLVLSGYQEGPGGNGLLLKFDDCPLG